ncbi:MAG TPA: PilN domain-containing protein, partial [Xanthomonadales bacterium]|nr:PilN domain-containing protein [Xanthomonadales bacterium]
DGDPVRVDLAQDPADVANATRAVVAAGEEAPDVVYCLAPGRLLRRPIVLPAAAEENLLQVLGFEMDRQTPFTAAQVFYDARIVARDAAAKQVRVELVLVPRTAIEADLATLANAGVALDGVDGTDAAGNRLGFNLLPADRRARRADVWLRGGLALAAVVVVLLAVVMAQSVANHEKSVEALRTQTEKMRNEARAVAAQRTALKQAIEGANFLVRKKRSRPPVIDLLLDVTRILPTDTWLQRLSVTGDQVQLQGQAREAAGLITILQRSPLLESPALQGAITPDARTNKEQFLIQAKLRAAEPAAAATAAPRQRAAQPAAPDATPATAPAPDQQPEETRDAVDAGR